MVVISELTLEEKRDMDSRDTAEQRYLLGKCSGYDMSSSSLSISVPLDRR
jgi:hypothetical protein